jgi:hypothetical protein
VIDNFEARKANKNELENDLNMLTRGVSRGPANTRARTRDRDGDAERGKQAPLATSYCKAALYSSKELNHSESQNIIKG